MSSSVKKTSLYIDEDMLDSLKIVAINRKMKVNDIIVELVQNYLKEIDTGK